KPALLPRPQLLPSGAAVAPRPQLPPSGAAIASLPCVTPSVVGDPHRLQQEHDGRWVAHGGPDLVRLLGGWATASMADVLWWGCTGTELPAARGVAGYSNLVSAAVLMVVWLK
ncbi:unnamed protein product, partial [Urochloa humidicola]